MQVKFECSGGKQGEDLPSYAALDQPLYYDRMDIWTRGHGITALLSADRRIERSQ